MTLGITTQAGIYVIIKAECCIYINDSPNISMAIQDIREQIRAISDSKIL